MEAKKPFMDKAKQLGVEVSDSGDFLTITAPKGKVFQSWDSHYETIHYKYDGWTKNDAYKELHWALNFGLADCEDQDCEFCNN